MRTPRIILMLAVGLAFGCGCARPDWIEQTLVTVDVTRTWRNAEGGLFELKLVQQGSKVTGFVVYGGGYLAWAAVRERLRAPWPAMCSAQAGSVSAEALEAILARARVPIPRP
jgi:hypothetical protein